MRFGHQAEDVASDDRDLSESQSQNQGPSIHRRHRPLLYVFVLGVFVMIHFLKST